MIRWDRQPSNHTLWLLSEHGISSSLTHCANARWNRCQEDINSFPFGELEKTTWTPSYYVDEYYPAGPEIQHPLLEWSNLRGLESSTLLLVHVRKQKEEEVLVQLLWIQFVLDTQTIEVVLMFTCLVPDLHCLKTHTPLSWWPVLSWLSLITYGASNSSVCHRDLLGDRNHTHPHLSPQTLFPSPSTFTSIPAQLQFHPRPSPSIFIPSPFHPRPRTYSRQQVEHKFWWRERN